MAPSWLGPYYKGDKRIRSRGAPDGKTECRAPEESRDKMACNFNMCARGVTHIMESGKIIERMFFLGRSGKVGDLPHLVSRLTRDRGVRSGLLTRPIRQ